MAISPYPFYNNKGNVTIGGAGGTYASPIAVATGAGTGSTWTSTAAKGQLKVEGKDADILINEQSLSEWMQAVDKRLSILRPNPELQEKYSEELATIDGRSLQSFRKLLEDFARATTDQERETIQARIDGQLAGEEESIKLLEKLS